ncbi:bifunctional DNA primase/polymerase [Kaustia mangrovi]|uniref:Bifunctional DNA primase/polymerase n=1 Tax=Kaustia mangrovi TaxID=2593653 RepID=A0A7S8C4W6_9HYPH|nr:bifunctional DNA primase/polymerase [Kaustia mangrovi]QPC43465.1 bifunctional DNA primase/polymerase [Kaustia mangrovi]
MQPLDLALDYAASGWPVFPCDPATKRPLVKRGLHAATDNAEQIRKWWARHPGAMIGVPTGERSGVWVLDLDVKGNENGPDALGAMEQEHGALPPTVSVRTPSGGRHLLFQYVDGVRNRGRLAPGIDVRGEGGYVIAPGSVNADGCFYEWVDRQPAPALAPSWLLERVLKRGASVESLPAADQPNTRYVEAAIADELSRLTRATHGRNNALNDAAFALGTFVGAGALSEEEAGARLFAAAQANGYVSKDGEHAARQTIASGLKSGMADPRDIPEAPTLQNDDPALAAEGARLAASLLARPEAEQLLVRATPYVWCDPSALPRRQWLYGSHMVRKYMSLTVAPGGVGKSSLAIAEALAMVTGRALLGEKPTARSRVWYFNGEDDRDELNRRIAGACKRYGIAADEVAGRLFVDSGREQDMVIVREERRDIHVAVPVVDAIKRAIIENGIDVLVVDPFVSTHGVPENDNGAIDKVAKLWTRIAEETNVAVELVHHVKKTDGKEVTVDDARGAGSLLAAARSVRVLNRMSDEQAGQAGVPREERFSYFSVNLGKANLAPSTGSLAWRRLESVPLGNGQGIAKPQDHAGVVVPWQWPTAEAIAGEVAPDALEAIKARIRGGAFRQNEQAKDWVGLVVAEVLGIEADKAGKRKIKKLLNAWLDDGQLREVVKPDPVKREPKKFVEVV